jgi:hypothetical protein
LAIAYTLAAAARSIVTTVPASADGRASAAIADTVALGAAGEPPPQPSRKIAAAMTMMRTIDILMAALTAGKYQPAPCWTSIGQRAIRGSRGGRKRIHEAPHAYVRIPASSAHEQTLGWLLENVMGLMFVKFAALIAGYALAWLIILPIVFLSGVFVFLGCCLLEVLLDDAGSQAMSPIY